MAYVDLRQTLDAWDYDPSKMSVRKILGVDDNVRIQMRIELGILQMEAHGRPDGLRPHGKTSLLDYFQGKLSRLSEKNRGDFRLSAKDCDDLRQEASLYYRRYIALFVLEEWKDVIRDTEHSLAIFDLCRDFAFDEKDRKVLEEYRPYVLMMRGRGQAFRAIEEKEIPSAISHLKRTIIEIQGVWRSKTGEDAPENSDELVMLRHELANLLPLIPSDSAIGRARLVKQLSTELQEAVREDRFEAAAQLRDRLQKLGKLASD